MASVSAEIQILIATLKDAQAVSFGIAGLLALLTYDICVFFSDEFETIWKSRWSWGKVLYFVFRYGSLFDLVVLLINTRVVDPPRELCQFLSRFQLWIAILVFWAMEVIQALRTAALFGESKIVKRGIYLYCLLQNLFMLCLTIAITVSASYMQLPIKGVTCSYIELLSKRDLIILQASGLLYEVVLWILGSVRISQMALGGRSKLAWIIFKDTVIYFPVNTILSLVTFLTFMLLPEEHGMLLLIVDAAWLTLMSIVITRMVFHLRAYLSAPPGASPVAVATGISGSTMIVTQPIVFKSWEVVETASLSSDNHEV